MCCSNFSFRFALWRQFLSANLMRVRATATVKGSSLAGTRELWKAMRRFLCTEVMLWEVYCARPI